MSRQKKDRNLPRNNRISKNSTTSTNQDHEDTIAQINYSIKAGDIKTARKILDDFPDDSEDHRVLSARAHILSLENRLNDAIEISQKALEKGGKRNSAVLSNHGSLLNKARRYEETINLLRPYVEAFPNHDQMDNVLTNALIHGGHREEARKFIYSRLGKKEPDTQILNDLGNLLFDLGERELGFRQYQLALALDPRNNPSFSNLLLVAHYLPNLPRQELLKLYEKWYANIIAPLEITDDISRDRNPSRPLRIGFISNGFRAHPAGWMSFGGLRILANYFDNEIFIYNKTAYTENDPLGPAFPKLTKFYRNVVGWSEDYLYKVLLEDQLDIVVEMTGHSGDSSLPVIARRVAPIQVKWVGGLFDTSAVPTMDYILSDWHQTPPGVEHEFVEKFVRLPGGYVTYTEPPHLPEVGPLPSKIGHAFTFGCMNNLFKINEEIAAVWSGILAGVPGSRLLLKDRRLDDPSVRDWVTSLFTRNGIEPDRLLLEEASPHNKLLETYNRIDLALDPWPYTGGLTTIEALYMGVPVVTKPGESFAGKHASSHLANAGLTNFIARDFDQYQSIAISWAEAPDDLASLRYNLRDQCRNSLLGNHVQLAANMDHAFRLMWENWCNNNAPANINFEGSVPVPDYVINKMTNSFGNAPRETATTAFIVGCGHSGTTLLARILGENSETYVPPIETETFLHGRERAEKSLRHYLNETAAHEKKLLVEKTPRHVYAIDIARELAPESKFIAMVRDGRDVVSSLMHRGASFESALQRWKNDNQPIIENWGKDDVLVLRYEDLITQTETEIGRVCAFLGIPFEDGMLEHHVSQKNWFGQSEVRKGTGVGPGEHEALRNWQVNQPIFDGRGRWKETLSPEQAELITQGPTKELMKQFGYLTDS